MDWIWILLLQQQAAAAEAERKKQEAAAKAKAESDASAARAAQDQRLTQIAAQRQQDAQSAAEAEAARLAQQNTRKNPIAPGDMWSPVGGTFYGSGGSQASARQVTDAAGGAQGVMGNGSLTTMQFGADGAMPPLASGQSILGGGERPARAARPQGGGMASMFGEAARSGGRQTPVDPWAPQQRPAGGGGSARIF